MDDERLKAVMADILAVDVATITDDASPETIATWDSLHHMTLVVAVEDEFDVQLPEGDLGELTTYAALSASLRAAMASQA